MAMDTQAVQRAQIYETLPPEHIRIAHFRKSKEGRLHGTLESIQLADLPNVLYTALSYACQDGCPTRTIALNGQKAVIRRTLYGALSSLMSTSKVSRLSFWADEICINQNDGEEKRDQMSLMSEIYGRATKVIGWLGSSSGDSDFAFEVLRLYSTMGLQPSVTAVIKRCFLILELIHKRRFSDAVGLASFIGPYGKPWQSLESLLQRDWFHRLWIVQEAALARNLVLRCGSKELTGDEFFAGIQIRGFAHFTDPSMPFLQAPYRNAYYLGFVRGAVHSGLEIPLAHLAHMFGRWECTEDVDRLNSLFALAYRDNRNDGLISPSSRSSPAVLYENFAIQSIRTSENLAILHFAGLNEVSVADHGTRPSFHVQTAGDIPTWVPDWRLKTRPVHSLRLPGDVQPYNCTSSRADFAFTAYGLQPDCPLSLDVSAVKIDKIKKVCKVFLPSFGDGGKTSFTVWISFWYKEVQKHLPPREIDEAFSSTLIMEGKLRLIERPDLTITTNQAAELFQQLRTRDFESFTEPDGDKLEAPGDNALGFVAYAEEVCRYRSLFITENGRLGLGSAYVPEGGSIFAIHGLKTPFIIDQSQGYNFLHGECYLNGAMDLGLSRSSEDVRLTLG